MRVAKYKFRAEENHAIELDRNQRLIIDQKLNYIHQDPVTALIVKEPEHYLFTF